ncbi:arginine deiminase [Clostridium swellfunianum]|uniref:arginine deiminase n=1 Tax=Clostridium swellfunianum TaxID=1367462 RepID=UPI002030F703|nr:arginine deiminase [Clostridium swellfunianum]
MAMERKIKVYSEIGNLKTVLLHRPGAEIENLIPEHLARLLFDDIPFLRVARTEHDNFSKVLSDNGVEVLYIENLAAQAVKDKETRESFLDEVIAESEIKDENIAGTLKNYLRALPEKEMIDNIIAGIRNKEIGLSEDNNEYPFIMEPMPNLYFTRDPFASIGRGITLNSMKNHIRHRETIFAKYVFKYHQEFKNSDIPLWYNRNEKFSIEGGDELIFSDEVIAIGNSERTSTEAIMRTAKNIFEARETFKTVLMFNIPKSRAFMHLDTVFTMIDYDKFTVHQGIEGNLQVSAITYDYKNKALKVTHEEDSLERILSKYLNRDITLIRCGGGDRVIGRREQWNDGSNTLAISPGKVITYERNYITNEILDKHNVKVISIPSGELSRGRGGPRCMSQPLFREDIK